MEYQQQRETFEQVNEATSPRNVFWTMDCYRGSVAVHAVENGMVYGINECEFGLEIRRNSGRK